MTFRYHMNQCEKQLRLYIAFVSETAGDESLKLLDEITRLRYVVQRIRRMTESEQMQKMKVVNLTLESILNENEI